MLKKIRVKSFTNSPKKSKATINATDSPFSDEHSYQQSLLVKGRSSEEVFSSPTKIPVGFFAVYVGEGRDRFLVPTSFLSHPLFKILLEKAYDEFGFEQKNGLIVPCSLTTFQQVVDAVESNHGRFDMRKLFEDFVV